MSEWLQWATFAPAPDGHCGYSFRGGTVIACEVERKFGVVIHSAGGNFQPGNMPTDIMAAAGNSWHASIMKDGSVQKHYSHPCFTAWHAGGPMQNLLLIGIEMDGYHHEPWTGMQFAALRDVLEETWEYCGLGEPKWGRSEHVLGKTQLEIRWDIEAGCNLYDHRWLSATDCPGGRNDAHRDEVLGWLKEEQMVDWPLEREKLLRDFMAWLAYYPLTQEEKNDGSRQANEDYTAQRFYQRQISWRRPGIEG